MSSDPSGGADQRGSSNRSVPVVLLHAIGLDRHMWDETISYFPDDIDPVAVDLRGFGSRISQAPVSIAAHAQDIVALLDARGIRRAHVVGLSYGGAVATAVAHAYPQRVASLALVASVITGPADVLNGRADAAEAAGEFSAYLDETLARWFVPEFRTGPEAEYVRACLAHTPVAHWAAGWRALARHDGRAMLADIRTPSLVVAGDFDVACPPPGLREAAELLPAGRYREIPTAAHMIALEEPQLLADILGDHVRSSTEVSGGKAGLSSPP